jgi:TP901 family phage tail tape measure protein
MSMDKLQLMVRLGLAEKVIKPLKDIKIGAGATAKAFNEVKAKLKELNDEQGKINRFTKTVEAAREASAAYKKQKDALGELTGKLQAAKAAQADMTGAVKVARAEHKRLFDAVKRNDQTPGLMSNYLQSKAALEKMEGGYNRAKNATRRLQEEIKSENRELDAAKRRKDTYTDTLKRISTGLKDAGIGTKNLTERNAKLTASIAAANAVAEKHGKTLQRLSAINANYDKSIALRNKWAMAGATTMAAGVAVGTPIMKTVREFAIAEEAATQLKVAMMKVGGKVPEEFKRINELASELGNRLPGTTADYQNMMTMLIRQGMPAERIIGGLGKATAYLGVQLRMPMEAAAEFSSKLQDATRTSNDEMMGLMDTIQRVSYLGVESDNMLQAFTKLSPALSMIKKQGLEAANAFAPLIVMADQAGMRGEAVGNAYRKVFQFALDAKKLGKANDALAGTGIGLDFSNGKGEFGGMDKLFANLNKLKSLSTMKRNSVIKELFGDDAETLQVVSLLIDKGKAGYEDVQAKMAAQADIQRRVNEQLGTLSQLWDAASGTFTNAMVAWGESISPELKAVTKWIQEMSEKLGNFAKEHPGLTSVLMKTAAVFGGLLVLGGGFLIAVSAILGPLAILRFGFSLAAVNGYKMWQMLKVVFMFLRANPIIAAISLLAAAAFMIYDNWAPIKEFFSNLWDGITEKFMTVVEWFKEKLAFLKPLIDVFLAPAKLMLALGVGVANVAQGQPVTVDNSPPITAPAARGGNSTFAPTLTIHAAPGMNEQQLANLVTREIERVDRERAAKARSSLKDRS